VADESLGGVPPAAWRWRRVCRALLPLFSEQGGAYQRTGAYRLPLYEGKPPKGLLTDLELGKPPMQALRDVSSYGCGGRSWDRQHIETQGNLSQF
jgi:hypothetical protein